MFHLHQTCIYVSAFYVKCNTTAMHPKVFLMFFYCFFKYFSLILKLSESHLLREMNDSHILSVTLQAIHFAFFICLSVDIHIISKPQQLSKFCTLQHTGTIFDIDCIFLVSRRISVRTTGTLHPIFYERASLFKLFL